MPRCAQHHHRLPGLLQQLQRGAAGATDARRPLARLWGLIFAALDGSTPLDWIHRGFAWMSSHGSRAVVGHAMKSDGRPVTAIDWRANRLADGLAKQAAHRFRAPKELRDLLDTATRAVEHAAALLGLQTRAANNYPSTEWREDGTAHTTMRRDAMPRPYWAHGTGERPHAAASSRPRTTSRRPAAPPPPPTPPPAPDGHAKKGRTTGDDQEALQEARFLAAWHQERAQLERKPQPTPARERLEALKQRVLKKANG